MILANPDNLELSEFENLIRAKFIDGIWFYADQWGLPELFFDWVDFREDPTWHQFEGIEFVSYPTTPVLEIQPMFIF